VDLGASSFSAPYPDIGAQKEMSDDRQKCPHCDYAGYGNMFNNHVWTHWKIADCPSLENWIAAVTHKGSSVLYSVTSYSITAQQIEAWLAAKPSVSDLTFALIWHVKNNKPELCDLFIKAGAQMNVRDDRHNTTATRMATIVGEDIARYIFLKGGDPKEEGCIMTAGLYGHFELVKLLVMAGAEFTKKLGNETTIEAIEARGESNKMEIVKFLRDEAPALAALCASHKTKTEAKEEAKLLPTSSTTTSTVAPSEAKSAKRIMISYQWDNQPIIKRLAESLKSAGYNVWLDLEQMSGSTLSAMADAVEGSEVVVVCLSSKYQNSKNCRLEGEYAHLNSKTIVPLMMEGNFRPTGWLGLIIGGRLWFDFTNEERHTASYQGLLSELQRSLGPPKSGAALAGASPSPPPPPPAIDKFATIANVPAWLKENGISAQIELDAACLSELARMRAKEASPVRFVNFLLNNITKLDTTSALRLSNALK